MPMANGTELLNSPWETILSPFTDLLGSGFYIIPISVIAAAIFMKTRDIVSVGVFMILAGSLLSGAGIFQGYFGIVPLYIIIVALGITSVVIGLLFMRK